MNVRLGEIALCGEGNQREGGYKQPPTRPVYRPDPRNGATPCQRDYLVQSARF